MRSSAGLTVTVIVLCCYLSCAVFMANIGPFSSQDLDTNAFFRCRFWNFERAPDPDNSTQVALYVYGPNVSEVVSAFGSECKVLDFAPDFTTPVVFLSGRGVLYERVATAPLPEYLRCELSSLWGMVPKTQLTFETFDVPDCTVNQWYDWVPSNFSNALCLNVLNQTCGNLPGRRTIAYNVYTEEFCTDGTYRRSCTLDKYIAYCWTPPCPPPAPVDCEVALEFGPWSSCYAFQGNCMKSRVKSIVTNPANGGLECPTLEQRTEIGNCTVQECQAIQCEYSQLTVVGNCTAPCGPSLLNTTVYNISLTPLAICTQEFEPIVSINFSVCTTNLPCQNNDTVTPVNISCYTVGNRGPRGNGFGSIFIDFTGVELQFNGSNASLVSSFSALHSVSGRLMSLDPRISRVNGSRIELGLLITSSDYEPSTGYILDVLYTPHTSSNETLLVDDLTVASFKCQTQDRSPPRILYASAAYIPKTTRGLLSFTEDVSFCDDPEDIFSGADFNWTSFVNSTSSDVRFFAMGNPQSFAFNGTFRLTSNATVSFMRAGVVCDSAGNPNEAYSIGDEVPVEDFTNVTYLVPGYGLDTMKLIRNNVTGIISAVAIFTRIPVFVAWIQAEVASFRLTASFQSTSGQVTQIEGVGSTVVFENIDQTTESTTQFLVFVEQFTFLQERENNLTLTNFTVFFPSSIRDYLELPSDFADVTPEVVVQYPSTNVPSPLIVSVSAYPGDFELIVTFDRPKQFSAPFLREEFSYNGDNRIVFVSFQIGRVVSLVMAAPFTYTMLEKDRLIWINSAPSAQSTLSSRVVSNALGPRPVIQSAIFLREDRAFMWNRLRVEFSATIGSFSIPPLQGISFNWTNPVIRSITPTNYVVSGKTITYTLSVVCSDPVCYDASGPYRVTIRGVNNVAGVLMEDYERVAVVDTTASRPVSAIRVGPKRYLITFNKELQESLDELVSLLDPAPEICHRMINDSYTCVYGQDLCAGKQSLSVRVFYNSSVTDANFNPLELEPEYTAQCAVDENAKCDITELPWYSLYPLMIFAAVGGITSILWIIRYCRSRNAAHMNNTDPMLPVK